MAECVSSTESVIGSHVCSVRYTTNSTYTGLSDPLTTMLDTPLVIPGLNISITYYFEFSFLDVDNSLMIVEQTNFTAPMSKLITSYKMYVQLNNYNWTKYSSR